MYNKIIYLHTKFEVMNDIYGKGSGAHCWF